MYDIVVSERTMQLFSRYTYIILTLAFFQTLLLTVLHHCALEYLWYCEYWWFDIPMHFMGGFLGGILAVWAYCRVPYVGKFLYKFVSPSAVVVLLVFFVTLLWEVFEVWAGISIHEPRYLFDTTKDMMVGMLGGTVSLLFVRWIEIN